MEMTFNFIGMCVANWQAAFDFFVHTLGIHADLNPDHGDWAVLGASWQAYYSETHSLVCEVFDEGVAVAAAERSWGRNQNIRPAIHVTDLDSTVERLKARGVQFTGEIEIKVWGRQIEFMTVEGIRWALADVPGSPVREDFSRPQFGHIAIRTRDLEAQKHFYTQIMGFTVKHDGADDVLLTQKQPDHPFIILQQGGERVSIRPHGERHPERSHPFFLSLLAKDVRSTAAAFNRHDLTILRPLTDHRDWAGTDLIIADSDGNVIQIAEYW